MQIYDPIGIVAPLVLTGKKFNQRLCAMKLDWDAELPEDIASEIARWYDQISRIGELKIPRSFGLTNPPQTYVLHVFGDAATIGYGAVAYLVIEETREVKWVAAKSRVSPTKESNVDVNGSIPRLELQAAVTAVELAVQIEEEIDVPIARKVFHTDSTTVYWWIQNESANHPPFVANRLNKIRLASVPADWHHVPTTFNPGDVVSRGAGLDDKASWDLFHNGPGFLRCPEEEWPPLPTRENVMVGALEVATQGSENESVSFIDKLLRRKSDYNAVKRIVAYVLRFVRNCRSKAPEPHTYPCPLPLAAFTVTELDAAEDKIVIDVQSRHFGQEIAEIQAGANPKRSKRFLNKSASAVRQLSPFIDAQGLLRVGGRMEFSEEPWRVQHPIILPQKDPFTNHVISAFHTSHGHGGTEYVLAGLRRQYWILCGRQAIKSIIWRCIPCRKNHRLPEQQQMAPLPSFRLSIAESFTDTAVDLAGPFQVTSGRKGLKVWIVLFVCLRVRAVYLDLVKSLESQEFLEILQRFHAFYPTVRYLHSDQGTNLVGANNILKKMLLEWRDKTEPPTQRLGIEWHFIPPHAPHQGGSWERIVALMKKVLNALSDNNKNIEHFRTLVIVTAGFLNRRPLTKVSSHPSDDAPLTPMHFILPSKVLTSSSDSLPATPLSGSSLRRSMDALRPAVDTVWKRFKSEYVPYLQRRTKWISQQRNLKVGDYVLVVDELFPREQWPTAVIMEVFPSSDGLIRRVRVRTAGKKVLERDIRKIVLLEREGEEENTLDVTT